MLLLLFPSISWWYLEIERCKVPDLLWSFCAFFKGELMEAIKRDFGSFANFKEKLTAVSVGVQGSGWGWLGYNKEQGRLQIAACANQDPLQGTTGQVYFLPLCISLCRFHRQVYEIWKGFCGRTLRRDCWINRAGKLSITTSRSEKQWQFLKQHLYSRT